MKLIFVKILKNSVEKYHRQLCKADGIFTFACSFIYKILYTTQRTSEDLL